MPSPEPIGAVLARVVAPEFRAEGYRCNGGGSRTCSSSLSLPGTCDECARALAEEAIQRRIRSWARTLPERQRDVSWTALAGLKRDGGSPRVNLPAGHLRQLRRQIKGARWVVLEGPAGAGKTTIAACWARALVERHPDQRVRFVGAADLAKQRDPSPLDLAVSAEWLVLDDLGAELEGAPAQSGLAAQRIGPGSHVICERFELGRPTLVTTGFDRAQVELFYGDRVARRLYESAVIVRLGPQDSEGRR